MIRHSQGAQGGWGKKNVSSPVALWSLRKLPFTKLFARQGGDETGPAGKHGGLWQPEPRWRPEQLLFHYEAPPHVMQLSNERMYEWMTARVCTVIPAGDLTSPPRAVVTPQRRAPEPSRRAGSMTLLLLSVTLFHLSRTHGVQTQNKNSSPLTGLFLEPKRAQKSIVNVDAI